ncbi:transcription initiation factor TFIID subunit 4-like [Equus caballus]|uniref:transcription initiation factor TFIID subunit 4-like n=1 Tax=Equus caballus TaxID=9796 RepID=UPI0038B36CE6
MSFRAVSTACWSGHKPLASETLGSSALRQRPASGLGEAGSVYTCHEGGGGRQRKPRQSPKLLNGSREGAAGAELRAGGSGGAGRAGGGRGGGNGSLSRPVPGMARRGPRASGAAAAAGVPAPAAEEGRAEARSPQARRAGTVPEAPGSAAGRCPRPGGGSSRWAGPGRCTLFPRAAQGAERWRSPGSSGAAAMGMAQGPGEDLTPRGRTGYSDARLLRAEGRLLTALSAKQRHGRPPGVSALPRDPHPITLRPLPPPPPPPPPPRRPPAHSTHSPIMQRGDRCRRHVTSGRRWLGRGRALAGAEGWGEDTPGELVSQKAYPCAGAVAQRAGRHLGCGQAALFLCFLASHLAVGGKGVLSRSPPAEAALQARDRCSSAG